FIARRTNHSLTLYPCFQWTTGHGDLHSFPTRRSSDLFRMAVGILATDQGAHRVRRQRELLAGRLASQLSDEPGKQFALAAHSMGDRKSTRLNSSHVATSYAVLCLQKKNRMKRI